jgi:sialate O-acetylesterase
MERRHPPSLTATSPVAAAAHRTLHAVAVAAAASLLLLSAAPAAAQYPGASFPLNFSNTHGSHMVLQRGVAANVWGFGTLFLPVTLTLTGAGVNASVGGFVSSLGVWSLQLPPQAAGGPFNLSVASPESAEAATLTDVYFGDVVVCGGQSNMAYGMAGILNASALIADTARRPLIRILSSQYSAQNVSQLQVVNEFAINWTIAAPDTVPGFSAVCYLTAAAIYDEMAGTLPLGLIDTSVGGTAIELWLPPRRFNDCAAAIPPGMVFRWPWSASCWFNGMVSPFVTGPTDVAFFIYDQGENDRGFDEWYSCAFPLLVRSWRAAFGNPAAPFFFVQLPPYIAGGDWTLASMRDTQMVAGAVEPGVFGVVTIDDGDAYEGCIHNRDKAVVGARLGAAVLALHYNVSGIPFRFPAYAGATAVTTGSTITVTVAVTPDATYGGLEWRPPAFDSNATLCPTARGINETFCAWFEVQASDGAWYNATAAVGPDGASVVLTVTTPTPNLTAVATRNGWGDWPVTNVYSGAGLPLTPWGPRNVTSAVVAEAA